MKEPFQSCDFHPCPICGSLMAELWCGKCEAYTVLPWELIGVGHDKTV
jgi:hypothetical protein